MLCLIAYTLKRCVNGFCLVQRGDDQGDRRHPAIIVLYNASLRVGGQQCSTRAALTAHRMPDSVAAWSLIVNRGVEGHTTPFPQSAGTACDGATVYGRLPDMRTDMASGGSKSPGGTKSNLAGLCWWGKASSFHTPHREWTTCSKEECCRRTPRNITIFTIRMGQCCTRTTMPCTARRQC